MTTRTDLVFKSSMNPLYVRGARTRIALPQLVFAGWVLLAFLGAGQMPRTTAQPPPEGTVRLNLQGEIKLQALIDYVSERLNIRFIYSTDISNRTINVRAPSEIPISSLLPLLGSVLRMEGLVLVDADVPGWKRVVEAQQLAMHAQPGRAEQIAAEDGLTAPVTQAFVIEHVDAQQLSQIIRPFLTQPGSNILAAQNTNVLIVTDYARNVLTVERLIKLIDRPRGQVVVEFYEVQHTQAPELAEQVQAMLPGPSAAPAAAPRAGTAPRGAVSGGTSSALGVQLLAEPRTNQIVVVGPQPLVVSALDLLRRFDVSLGAITRVYRFRYVQAERFDKMVISYLPAQERRLYTSSPDKESNLLIVRAPLEVHQRIDELREQVDVPVQVSQSPIQFYKLKNANALDVLYTLLALQEVSGSSVVVETTAFAQGGLPGTGTSPLGTGIATPPGAASPFPGVTPSNVLPRSMPGAPFTQPGMNQGAQTLQMTPLPLVPPQTGVQPYDQLQQTRLDRLSGALGGQFGTGAVATLPGGARVSADPTTNSIVVVATPEAQEMYRNLIESLDVRRPQVLVEAKIIAVDTTDDFALGVEFSVGDRTGDKRLFNFTSFGLSEVDPLSGALRIIPMTGFNGTLVDPDVADMVVKALASHDRAKVLAAPKILVNDNSEGQLESVVSVPFASVNASQTVSTTSLGGDQQAGTIITVTPHISEGDHLTLEFAVEFSTFTPLTEASAAALPPPRQIDRVESVVTIPDGQTVIVGGLKRISDSSTFRGVPWAEQIPVLRELTSITTTQKQTTSFFLFIRPLILRDDLFVDLKYVSDKSIRRAHIGGEHPVSRPVMMK